MVKGSGHFTRSLSTESSVLDVATATDWQALLRSELAADGAVDTGAATIGGTGPNDDPSRREAWVFAGLDDAADPVGDTPEALVAPDTSGVNDAPTVTIAAPGTSYAKVGSEFLVNTQTAQYQLTPTITSLANGGFVVTWSTTDTTQDGSGNAIKAQIYTAAGAKVGGEFLVNTQTSSNQTVSVVTGLTNGNFVVAWTTADTSQDGSGASVKAQIFTAAGVKVGVELLVNTQITAGQYDPTITGLANGGFVVTWTDGNGSGGDSSFTSVKGQVFTASGAKVGSEFLVNTQTALAQEFSAITSLANGGFVATWRDQSGTLGDASGYSIKAQIFTAAGVKTGGEFLVNTQTASNQFDPTITGLANGGFVATWRDQSGTLGDASGASVKAQIFTAAGVAVGGEFLVNTATAGDQYDPTVTGLANGNFVVTWWTSDPSQDGSGRSVKAQVFTATGGKVGSEFQVNMSTLSDQDVPTVTALANGGFVVTWQDASGTLGDPFGTTSIKAQIYGASGGAFTATEQVAQDLKGTITVGDSDAGTGTVTVTVAASYGALTLAVGTSGATIVSGNGTGSVVVSGTIPQLNALFGTDATSAISYLANTDAPPATATVTITANDGGNSGTGGALTGTGTFDIAIAAINDPPTVTITPPPGPFTPVGSEFLVNLFTANNQDSAQVTALSNGDFVVTWASASQSPGDTSGTAIKAQVFTAAGARVGGENLVNTATANDQFFPQITALSNGGFVVTWGDNSLGVGGATGDTSSLAVKAQVFTAGGAPVGTEIRVNTAIAGSQNSPQTTALSNGGFVVTWNDNSLGVGGATGDTSSTAVKAQVFTAAGAPVGTEIRVNTATASSQNAPQITALSNGGFVVTWNDSSLGVGGATGDASASAVKAQVFTAAGAPVGTEILVNTATASTQRTPQITALSNGGFVVTWEDFSQGVGGATGDASSLSVKAQVFTAAGAPVGTEIRVNTATASDQDTPQITALSNGGFVVTWRDLSQGVGGATGDTSSDAVKAQVFTAAGAPVGTEILVNTATASVQSEPQITALSNGGFVVTWQDFSQGVGGAAGDASNYAVKAQVFTATGAPVGAEILVNTATANNQDTPQITALPNGGFVVTWRDSSLGVGGDYGDSSGSAVKAQIFGPTAGSYTATEQVALNLKGGIAVADVDAGGGTITATLSVGYGLINVTAGTSGATVVSGNGTGSVVVSGTLAQINALLGTDATSTITFTANTDAPPASATLTVTVDDGGNTGTGGAMTGAASTLIAITAVNDAPIVTTSGGATAFVEGANVASTPVTVDSALTLNDPDTSMLASATVSITGGLQAAQDLLAFTNTSSTTFGNIAASYNATTGVLTLTSAGLTATVAQFEAALRAVTYTNSSDAPDITTRTISFAANDGAAASNIAMHQVTVAAVNDAPVLGGGGNAIAFTENGAAVAVDAALTVSDADGTTLSGATVTISAGRVSGDTLSFTDQNGITGTYNAGTGVLTLTGATTLANYQAALRSIIFSSTSEDPTGAARTISFVANDGAGANNLSAAATTTVNVTAVNDAPTLSADAGPLFYHENDAPRAISPTLALADVDNSTLASATVQITTGFGGAQDSLAFTNNNAATFGNIAATYNVATGLLTLTSAGQSATVAQFQAALRAVTYYNTSNAPDGTTRTITFLANDGAAQSVAATRQLSVTPVNDAPLVGGVGEVNYTENAAATILTPNLTVIDPDSPIAGATLRIFGLVAGDELAYTNQLGITGTYNGGTGVLTLSGTASAADYQTFLRSVGFRSTSDNPTANGANPTRAVSIVVSDGLDTNVTVTTSVNVIAVNDAPALDLDGGAAGTGVAVATNEQTLVLVAPNATLTDVDSADFSGGSLTVSYGAAVTGSDSIFVSDEGGQFAGGGRIGIFGSSVYYNTVVIGTIASSGLGNPLIINFNASATPAAVQQLIHRVNTINISDTPPVGPRTMSFTVTDGDGGSSQSNATVTITAVDDAPVAVSDNGATTETTATTGNVLINDTDVDGGPKTVTAVNGVTASVGQQITLGSGALLTLNAGGSYSYDPNGKFNYLVSPSTAAATGAADGQATDSFTYTLNGGSTTTVTITVTGEDGPGSELRGTAGNDTINGTPQPDLFNLSQGGSDTASGGASDDGFYMGAALDAGDSIDGQGGTFDQVALQGNYAGLVLGATTIRNVENIILLSGTDTRFGAPGGQSFSYNITINDATIAATQTLAVSANTLVAGESVTVNASAELDGIFVYYGGLATEVITGGQLNDGFFFGNGAFGAGDRVDGQGGNFDQLALQGNYNLTFGANQLISIESLVFVSAHDLRFPATADFTYNITMNDANVVAGHAFAVTANTLLSGESLTFNASAELDAAIIVYSGAGNDNLALGAGDDMVYAGGGTDTINGGGGADRITGGLGADMLTGGVGNDTFIYLSTSESTTSSQDHILDFTTGDHIDVSAIGQFTLVTGIFTGAGQLRVVSQGGGDYLVQAETTGDGIADLSILVTSDHALTAADFVGVTNAAFAASQTPDTPVDVAAGSFDAHEMPLLQADHLMAHYNLGV